MKKIKTFLFPLLLLTISNAQTPQTDSLIKILPTVTGKARLDILYTLSNQLENTSPKQALEYGLEGVLIAQQLGDSISMATLYSSLAFSSSELGDFTQSLKHGYHSLEISTQIGNKKKIASAHSTIGIAYVYIGQYSKALEHHLEALRLREELGLTNSTASTLNNIGVVYHNIGQYDKAIDYYKRAQERQGTTISDLVKVRYLTNIGYAEFKRGNFDAALKYHTTALTIAEKFHYTGILAYIYFNLGIMYSENHDYEKALHYLNRALSNYETLGQKYGVLQLLNAIGTTHYKSAHYATSLRYLNRAVVLAKQINAPEQLKISYETFFSIYDKTGPVAKAYQYYQLYSAAKDSLANSNESKKIAEILMRNETIEKQREIELLKKEKTIADLNFEKQSFRSKVLYAGVFLSITIIAFLYFINRRIQKNKLIVEQKNEELKLLNEELQQKVGEIHLLSGLLPICANCKKIRDDKNEWEQLEQYITKHSDAKFSHGLCPDCMKSLYGNIITKFKNQ